MQFISISIPLGEKGISALFQSNRTVLFKYESKRHRLAVLIEVR